MSSEKGSFGWILGAVGAALGASLCCILPLSVAFLGVGSAALAAWIEPLRPVFVILTVALLAFAFHRTRQARTACAADDACSPEETTRRSPIWLWLATVLALALVTFPYYVSFLF